MSPKDGGFGVLRKSEEHDSFQSSSYAVPREQMTWRPPTPNIPGRPVSPPSGQPQEQAPITPPPVQPGTETPTPEDAASMPSFHDRDHGWMSHLLPSQEHANNMPGHTKMDSDQLYMHHSFARPFTDLSQFDGVDSRVEHRTVQMGDREFHQAKGDLSHEAVHMGSFERRLERGLDGGLELHNEHMLVNPEFRGKGYSSQFYARQEDYLRQLTQHLPEQEKAKTRVTMLADVVIGRYQWMTQGYRFSDHATRSDVVRSWHSQLEDLLAGHAGIVGPEAGKKKKDVTWGDLQSMEPRSLDDLGLRESAEELRDKLWDAQYDENIEPWDLLAMDPGHRFLMRAYSQTDEQNVVPGSLIKFLALCGPDWSAVKYVHGPTEKDQEGIEFGDERRHRMAQHAHRSGRPWGWLQSQDK